METLEKLKMFAINMQFEAAEDVQLHQNSIWCQNTLTELKAQFPITQARLPNGRTIPLLKTMQTSVCERDCNYCYFRSGRDSPRASFTPDELASAIVKLSQAGIARGVFLSSGVTGGGIHTQDKIIQTATILREKYHYHDYIHLKIMPGAEKDQIFRAMQLADRVSINLEGPDEKSLQKLAPHKIFFEELLEPLRMIEEIRLNYPPHLGWKHSWPSSCTQFVVGAVGESDLELLKTTVHLQSQFKITRAYFSNFSPVIDTPFENLPPLNPWRQHRLYQAFFLLRDYQFDLAEIPFQHFGDLNLQKDPKLSWAESHLIGNPLEINTAEYHQLLKIPGIGPVTARKICQERRCGKIQDIGTLRKLGVQVKRVSRFILMNGVQPAYQPGLFR
jgi:predicted DNA-binding helix-hairpin-helix protein